MSAYHHVYRIVPYSRSRRAALDLSVVERKHLIHGLLDADVTQARALLREHKARTGETLSFTAFVITCVAQAVSENTLVQAYRRGRRHLVIFDDVDVTALMEWRERGRQRTAFHIIRAANHKTFRQIHQEIRRAQTARVTATPGGRMGLTLYEILPGVVRRSLIRFARRHPFIWRHVAGTVGVTAVGMFSRGGGWGIPTTPNTLDVTVGGIAERPVMMDGRVTTREFLCLTVSVDHDVIDGAPAARFAQRLRDLLESGFGLSIEPPADDISRQRDRPEQPVPAAP